jgi:hypothetical protein
MAEHATHPIPQGALWLTPEQALPFLGYRSLKTLYKDLREGKFPWRYVKTGVRYRICARSVGLYPEFSEAPSQRNEGQNQGAHVIA